MLFFAFILMGINSFYWNPNPKENSCSENWWVSSDKIRRIKQFLEFTLYVLKNIHKSIFFINNFEFF